MINIIKLTGTVATLSRTWYPTLVPYEIKYNFENSHWLLTLAIVRMQFLQVFKCNTVVKMCQYELMIKSISGILLYCNTLYVHLYTLKNIYLSLSLIRDLLAFIFIPVIQKEIDVFYKCTWNTHRIGQQKDAQMPKGIPDHVFHFPEIYGHEQCGKPRTNTVC